MSVRLPGSPDVVRSVVQLHLASRSPRRAELLRQIGVHFDVCAVEVEEAALSGQSVEDYTRSVALAKAQAPKCSDRIPVLGGDTAVTIDNDILGKPKDRENALEMLARLSNRWHRVFSAVAVVCHTDSGPIFDVLVSITRVRFGRIALADAEAYWNTGEPSDKAGAYAIQGRAARWIREIHGSFSGVVGLPLYETGQLLRRFGVQVSG